MIICFNGIDGSGKSLQAQRLVDTLSATGHPAVYVWVGGDSSFTRPLIRLGQRLLRAPAPGRPAAMVASGTCGQYRAYLKSTQRLFKRRLVRDLWLQVSLFEHACELWKAVLPQLMRGRIVICDRYIYDTVIGIAVLAGVETTELRRLLDLPWLYRALCPDRWFFLDLPADVAFRRKDDIPDLLFLERRIPLYRVAVDRFGMQVIDGTRSPDEIAAIVWQNVQPLLSKTPKPLSL